jgi:hypothetical protein
MRLAGSGRPLFTRNASTTSARPIHQPTRPRVHEIGTDEPDPRDERADDEVAADAGSQSSDFNQTSTGSLRRRRLPATIAGSY